jgi:hypothetical protein
MGFKGTQKAFSRRPPAAHDPVVGVRMALVVCLGGLPIRALGILLNPIHRWQAHLASSDQVPRRRDHDYEKHPGKQPGYERLTDGFLRDGKDGVRHEKHDLGNKRIFSLAKTVVSLTNTMEWRTPTMVSEAKIMVTATQKMLSRIL